MRRTVNCKLNTESINLIQAKLEMLQDNINIAPSQIVKKIITSGEDHAKTMYANYEYRNNTEDCVIESHLNDDEKSGYITFKGESAFYEEFGTGELGLADPHPIKNRFEIPLNDYNSGPFVSTHISKTIGKHYWFWRPMVGRKGYDDADPEGHPKKVGFTIGIPSGKIMYNTATMLEKESKNITKETRENILAIMK